MATVPAPQLPGDLPAAQDFYRLRREGIGHIEEAGHVLWSDYNTHDPGISMLEALAFAITELGYRTRFPIEDLLASGAPGATADDPYPDQTFFTARRILTVNPTTVDDLRRLLVDVDPVRNAWVRGKECACDAPLFAWCEDDEIVLSHDPSLRSDPSTELTPVTPRGLYDVLLELEADPTVGDLNDRKTVRRRAVVDPDGRRHIVTIEVRFPAWAVHRRDERQQLADDEQPLDEIRAHGPNRTTTGSAVVTDDELRAHWFDVFHVDFEVDLADGTTIAIENASLRVFGTGAVRRQTTVADLVGWLEDTTTEGFVEPYRRKLSMADAAVDAAKATFEAHRNLDEDVCRVGLVEIDEIAVCADVEVEATADIELVQARIWFEIERYLDPAVPFWSLQELRARGVPVEAIFDGPELDNGFLTAEGLRATDLRTELRVSDLLERLMDIDGVVRVEGLLLTAHDASGSPIAGISDPEWIDGVPVFSPGRISASWLMRLDPDHRPRLHRQLSRFLFTSRGLPFVPRLDEAEDTLVQLHGEAARPKIRATDLDLPVVTGRSRRLDAYHPVQHSLPLTYGIGPAGLPSTATAERRAQAKQLKAYLMVFEQLLRNAYAQVAHLGDLFSLDPAIDSTYFTARFAATDITGYDDVVASTLTEAALAGLAESPTEFLARRNRFLDHLLARFGETFGDHAMLATDLDGRSKAGADLIRDKLTFLRALPRISHDRGKAFDRSLAPCDPDNASGLHQRVNLLLGLPDWTFVYRAEKAAAPPGHTHSLSIDDLRRPIVTFPPSPAVEAALSAVLAERQLDTSAAAWRIEGTGGQLVLTIEGTGGQLVLTIEVDGRSTEEPLLGRGTSGAAHDLGRELVGAQRAILAELVRRDRYGIVASGGGWQVTVVDGAGQLLGTADQQLDSPRAAEDHVRLMATWAAHERAVVVEHLLLRPKFPGDAVYPVCTDDPDCTCCDADPYSFRLTYVLPGWTEPFSTDLEMRGFADRTIQEQTPSHLLVKTCWVGNDGYLPDPCEPVVDTIASLLEPHLASPDAACPCAAEIYAAFAAVFGPWLDAHAVLHDRPDVIAAALATLFGSAVDLGEVACADAVDGDLDAAVRAVLLDHFVAIARHGFQFERFEDAWCRWADADAAFDWTEERLQETVVAILAEGATTPTDHESLCTCAATILAGVGTEFRTWIEAHLAAGTPLDEMSPFAPSRPTLCPGVSFADGVTSRIHDLLAERYARYTEVSYRLRLLVDALAELRNTYPSATLHDCDEGSDSNPVRLGRTALGGT